MELKAIVYTNYISFPFSDVICIYQSWFSCQIQSLEDKIEFKSIDCILIYTCFFRLADHFLQISHFIPAPKRDWHKNIWELAKDTYVYQF